MNPRRIHHWRLLAVVALLPLVARAAEAGASGPAQQAMPRSGTASSTREAPALSRRPLSAEEQELSQIQEQGRLEVERLTRNALGMADGPALHALQRQVSAVKTEARVRFLRAHARFARARGDAAAAERAEALAGRLLNPPAPPAVTAPQPRNRPGVSGEGARP